MQPNLIKCPDKCVIKWFIRNKIFSKSLEGSIFQYCFENLIEKKLSASFLKSTIETFKPNKIFHFDIEKMFLKSCSTVTDKDKCFVWELANI